MENRKWIHWEKLFYGFDNFQFFLRQRCLWETGWRIVCRKLKRGLNNGKSYQRHLSRKEKRRKKVVKFKRKQKTWNTRSFSFLTRQLFLNSEGQGGSTAREINLMEFIDPALYTDNSLKLGQRFAIEIWNYQQFALNWYNSKFQLNRWARQAREKKYSVFPQTTAKIIMHRTEMDA